MFSFRSSFKLRIGKLVEEWELIVMDAFWLEQMTIEKDFAPLVTYRKSRKIYHNYNLHAHFIVRRWYDKNIFHRPKATSPLRFRTFNLLYVFTADYVPTGFNYIGTIILYCFSQLLVCFYEKISRAIRANML